MINSLSTTNFAPNFIWIVRETNRVQFKLPQRFPSTHRTKTMDAFLSIMARDVVHAPLQINAFPLFSIKMPCQLPQLPDDHRTSRRAAEDQAQMCLCFWCEFLRIT
jgi:hypothetical protein